MTHTFRALWPIVDSTIPLPQLIAEATADLPHVANRARAEVSPRGRWSVARSVDVPGSGRVTEHVLVYEAPARVKRRKWAADPVLRQRNEVTV